jgi:hypothetical protein
MLRPIDGKQPVKLSFLIPWLWHRRT